MMTRTDRRRFPILLAAIAALAMALLFSPVQAQEGSAPDKPTGLSATASHDSVTLTWDDLQDDSITGYMILRRNRDTVPKGKFGELVADTGTAATSYTDDTVAAETNYTYRIKAINEHGVSERSRWFHVDTPSAPVPAKPTGLSATASHDSVATTYTDDRVKAKTPYTDDRVKAKTPYTDDRVKAKTPYTDDRVKAKTPYTDDRVKAKTPYTDDRVKAKTPYTYRIKAINEYGVSERSRWFHIDTPAAPEAVEGDDQDEQGGEHDNGAPGHATPPGSGKRANVSEPDGEDLPDNNTTGEVDVGGSVTGNIGRALDRDWFKVELETVPAWSFWPGRAPGVRQHIQAVHPGQRR